ncbi:MAG: hypothetical protein QM737_15435 [Ferruginibacter sp.]
MADVTNDIKTIKKNDPVFPGYLDFDKLRREGIDYLGKLAGKIWTDHNMHDPGVTILEMLCYALLDIGYRTNLPASDIFATNDNGNTDDDNFLTASKILTCNPLTITDFRKLLIDIDGVKNAWLEVATDFDPEVFCTGDNALVSTSTAPENENNEGDEKQCCINYLNGLYHVLIDLEESKEKEIKDDKTNKVRNAFLKKIKQALLSHRNICEDFIDIRILCKWKIGVCAEIELTADADPEEVYLAMMEQLRSFFSPSPRFYNLSQLLIEKNKTIDEVFAGRPYNITESHGFVDTEEFEKLELKKSIHISDVYNTLFSIPGISKVQRLRLKNCDAGNQLKKDEWVVKIPKDHVPEFSATCSGFQFVRQGLPVSFDFSKYDGIIDIDFKHNGKILYKDTSGKLDTTIPNGYYRSDLGDWYSIQNEFPRVYGIGNDGLPSSASTQRKAQALQLKGYLLFFDQLFANYLGQLKNIRNLFTLKLGTKKENNQTYFINKISGVSDEQELLRLPITGSDISSVTAGGSFLAFPVNRKELESTIAAGNAADIDLEKIQHYVFVTAAERNIAVCQLQEDALSEQLSFHYITTKNDGCVFYYAVGSSDEYALIGSKYHADESSAKTAATNLLLAAPVASNYRLYFSASEKKSSFSIELKDSIYSEYLQLLVEDENIYQGRRKSFLNHLLARFAERFTDYALLSFGNGNGFDLQKNDIQAKEFFLSNYPLLSSGRGKAFNYLENGWNNDNVSGIEKKFKALIGAADLDRQSLCNFYIYKYDEKYTFKLNIAGKTFFTCSEKFDSVQEATENTGNLVKALAEKESYSMLKVPFKEKYTLRVAYADKKYATFFNVYNEEVTCKEVSVRLHKIFSPSCIDGKIFIVDYKYSAHLEDCDERIVRKLVERPLQRQEAETIALKSIKKINQPEYWLTDINNSRKIGKLFFEKNHENGLLLVDVESFKIDINNTIVGKPDKFTYELLDQDNSFKLISLHEFENKAMAAEDCNHLLLLLTKDDNYDICQDDEDGKWYLFIKENGRKQASSTDFKTRSEAERVKNEIRHIIWKHQYRICVTSEPYSWSFDHYLGYEMGTVYTIRSQDIYYKETEAIASLNLFAEELPIAIPEKNEDGWFIKSPRTKKYSGKFIMPAGEKNESITSEGIKELQEILKDVKLLSVEPRNEALLASNVMIDEQSLCSYVYQLVDKDHVYAFYKTGDKDKAVAENKRKQLVKIKADDYNFLELNIHSDNIIEETVQCRQTNLYRYQVKSSNEIRKPGGGRSEKIVLFESARAYNSIEEAKKAFLDNYLSILNLGSDLENYGEKKPISNKEILILPEVPVNNMESIVYVPADTILFLANYPEKAFTELVKISKSYPVRSIRRERDCVQFKNRFNSCADTECVPVENDCCSDSEPPVYYFVLYNKIKDKEDWQSVGFFETVTEASDAFRFFLLLLQYEGNYIVDCDCSGQYKIFIREVLAESIDRFKTKSDAWGKKGMQKFISISQSKESFHAFAKEDCCYSFFVACKNTIAVHPCKYDTTEMRNHAMYKLYHAAKYAAFFSADEICGSWDQTLQTMDGKIIATVSFEKPVKTTTKLSSYTTIISAILRSGICIADNVVYVPGAEGKIYFEIFPGSGINSLKELKEELLWLSCYFPFSYKEENGSVSYCIEIRLPGFNHCNTCGTDEEATDKWNVKGTTLCQAAWISECCYTDCNKLITAYNSIISWVKDIHFYRQVFDCHCGPYEILLHDDSSNCMCEEAEVTYDKPTHIVAVNPQCYTNPDIVCAAVKRAKKLINPEGVHLIEHILLRPHCKEDCDSRLIQCSNKFDLCKLPYWKDNDANDPCDQREVVCFEPGHDPYSFIATVALPAWSEKFRNNENRLLVENILQREAPAHVLLRILWLTPHDLCCFEKYLKEWLMWMAYKKSCIENYSGQPFIDFLFKQEFECLDERAVCETCETGVSIETCIDKIKKEESELNTKKAICNPVWFDQVTELFCWKNFNCECTTLIDCDELKTEEQPVEEDIPVPATDVFNSAPVEEISVEKTVTNETQEVVFDTISKSKFVNGRFESYKKFIEDLPRDSQKNNLVKRSSRFLDSDIPEADVYSSLITDLLKIVNKKDKKVLISHKLALQLIEIITFFLLDNATFNKRKVTDLFEFRNAFDAMKVGKVNTAKLYHDWRPASVKKYSPKVNLSEIEKLLTK